MLLDDQELRLLARFFAKRFPHAADRVPILDGAGLDDADGKPADAWGAILEQAQTRGALPALGAALHTDDPDDANLREVRRLLAGEQRTSLRGIGVALALAAGAFVVVGVGALAGARALTTHADAVEPSPVTLVQRVDAPLPNPAFTPPAPVFDEPDREPVVVAAVPERAAQLMPDPPGTDAAIPPLRCSELPWLDGYWYAGSEPPGRSGEVIVLPRAVNVRTTVPTWRNGWDARSPVQCVLLKGDRVRIGKAPIPVPVDRYWVSISADDLLRESG